MEGATVGADVSFAVLGPLEIRRDGRPIDIGGQRLRTLLTLLLLDAGRTVPTDVLVAGVWADRPPSAVGNALQALVSRLRAVIGRELVVGDPAGYRLAVVPDQVDLHRFIRLAGEGGRALAEGDPARAATVLREALALWRGPALADLPDGAESAEAARLEELRTAAIEDRIEADLLLGDRHAPLVTELRALIAAHPLRERLHGQLMRALYGSGRQVEALAAYEEARKIFADRLGVDPSPALADLHVAMLRGDPLPLRGPTPSSPAPRPVPGKGNLRAAPGKGNLRARLTSFIGRGAEVGRIGDLLEAGRLVTLLGPGGAGKTRLAIESAEACAPRVPDGVWLVELAPVSEPGEVPQAVLAALGLRDAALMQVRTTAAPQVREPEDAAARLVAALAARRMLIVLDNCEHVVDAAAALADRLLADCPGVRILATSREPLGITGEVLWPVGPLDIGDAVRLFADRASAVRPGYRVDGDRERVERICRELDGMPLAIELAAARLRMLTVDQIADRLGDRFRLLTGGSRTALPRHQTLRAVVEWSWGLLDDEERTLAARLAVFAGGATLEAVERVCAGDIDVLGRLVDKSLVVFDAGRYRMLETIRAYAAERLAESGEERRVRQAHAEFFTEFAEEADSQLRTGAQVEWLGRLATEQVNLSAALRWAVDTGRADTGRACAGEGNAGEQGTGAVHLAMRLVGALGWYWWLSGNRTEGAARAAEVLHMMPDGVAPARRALVLVVFGLLSMGSVEDWDRARAALEQAAEPAGPTAPEPRHPLVVLARPLRDLFFQQGAGEAEAVLTGLTGDADPWVAACAHAFRGHLLLNQGRVGEGEADLRAALDRYRAVGDRWGIANALAAMAEISMMRGDMDASARLMREAIDLVDAIGTAEDTSYMRAHLAVALNEAGDQAAAEAMLDEAHRVCLAGEDQIGMAGVLIVRGTFARQRGDFAQAAEHYAECIRLVEDTAGYPPQFRAMLWSCLGLLAEQEGDVAESRRWHGRALSAALDSWDRPVIGQVLIGRAGLAVLEGDPEQAARLLGAAAAMRGLDEVAGFDHRRITASAEAALGPEEFVRLCERGRAESLDEIAREFGASGAVAEGADGQRGEHDRDARRPDQ